MALEPINPARYAAVVVYPPWEQNPVQRPTSAQEQATTLLRKST